MKTASFHDFAANRSNDFDYILVGGGLQSGLLALALAHHRPDVRLAIIERDSKLAGNHTWSFHGTDLGDQSRVWVSPLMQHSWDQYDVRVGKTDRDVKLTYHTTSAEHFHHTISHTIESLSGGQLMTGSEASEVHPNHVVLDNGETLHADVVIDNRGPRTGGLQDYDGGFQKFWGFEVQLPVDWPSEFPRIMDDRTDQTDGFRFFYTLPFASRRVLIEDTRFSETPTIDREDCYAESDRYLRTMTGGKVGLDDCEIVREENGVLPMPMSGMRPTGDLESSDRVIAGGYRGGWFHAATGYSFASAVAFAELVATTPADQLRATIAAEIQQQHRRGTFARFLNRLLFRMVRPAKRYQIFARFYRVLPSHRIARFYANRFTAIDASRIVIGMPPGGLQPIRFARSIFHSISTSRSTKDQQQDRKQHVPAIAATSTVPATHAQQASS